jgi:hypothetical protein
MNSLLKNYWKILLLDRAPFEALREAPDAMLFALKLCLLVGVIAGAGKLARIPEIRQRVTLSDRLTTLTEKLQTIQEKLPPAVTQAYRVLAIIATRDRQAGRQPPLDPLIQKIGEFQATLATFQPPLGRVVSNILDLIGEWLVTPLDMLALWLIPILWVALGAKMMGGGGSLRQHVSLMLLALAPQALTFFSYLPAAASGTLATIAGVLNAIALAWSLAILVLAVAVANRYTAGQAFKAVAVTLVVIYVALPLLGFTLFGGSAALFWVLILR